LKQAHEGSWLAVSALGTIDLDSQGMDSLGHPIGEGIIHEAMAGQERTADERGCGNPHSIVAGAAACTGMAGMKMAFVDDFER
jgi:hypothetical protein